MTNASQEDLLLAAIRDSLSQYAIAQRPVEDFDLSPHHRLIISKLEAVERGEIRRLMIFLPPQHGKSLITSKLFPAWYFGRHPDRNVIAASYGGDFVKGFGRAVRNFLDSPIHRAVFPNCKLSRDSSAANAFTTTKGGEYYAVGRGGPITGRGGNCFPSGTLIETVGGPLDVEYLAGLQTPPPVLSYNHETNELEYQRIVATRQLLAAELVNVSLVSGRSVQSTHEHLIYTTTKQGYRQAQLLRTGDAVISLRDMSSAQELQRTGPILSKLLARPENSRPSSLRTLFQGVRQGTSRVRQGATKWSHRFLLYNRPFTSASRSKEPPQMQNLQTAASRTENPQVLHFMQGKTTRVSVALEGLRQLWQELSCGWPPSILFSPVRGSYPFVAYAGIGQFTFQDWNQSCQVIQPDEATNPRARQEPLYGLQTESIGKGSSQPFGSFYSPHQREMVGESTRESNLPLHCLSPKTPQVEGDTVSVVKRLRVESVPVFDIQVEGNHNFFANGILVHNCIIIDDPLKDRKEASSAAIREELKTWYSDVIYTRQRKDVAIVIVQTRWHVDDLAGWLLREHLDEGWEVISLPAVAEENDLLNRKAGEALWPSHFDEDKLTDVKAQLDGSSWVSLYQQRPTIGAGFLFRREWLENRTYEKDALPSSFRSMNRAILVDPANSEKKGSDYTYMWVVGASEDQNYYVLDILRDRLSLVDRAEALFTLHKKWLQPEVVGYEQYGMQADIAYLEDKMNREHYQFSVTPLTHKLKKFDRIERLEPLFRQGRIYCPTELWRTNRDGIQEDLVHTFIEEEYVNYVQGGGGVKHDDGLDSLSRIFDVTLEFPTYHAESDALSRFYDARKQRARGTAWSA